MQGMINYEAVCVHYKGVCVDLATLIIKQFVGHCTL